MWKMWKHIQDIATRSKQEGIGLILNAITFHKKPMQNQKYI